MLTRQLQLVFKADEPADWINELFKWSLLADDVILTCDLVSLTQENNRWTAVVTITLNPDSVTLSRIGPDLSLLGVIATKKSQGLIEYKPLGNWCQTEMDCCYEF